MKNNAITYRGLAFGLLFGLILMSFPAHGLFFTQQPQDFDRLFNTQVYVNGFPGSVRAARACKTDAGAPCLGYLSLRFANAQYSGGTFTARIEARAGQESIGTFFDVAGDTDGLIDEANPANILYDAAVFLTYNKQVFESVTAWNDACELDHEFYQESIQEEDDTANPPLPPIPSDDIAGDVSGTGSAYGVHAYVYTTEFDGDEPEELEDEERTDIQLLQWQHDEYRLMYTITCTLPAGHEGQTLGLAFHPLVVPAGSSSQHLGDEESRFYLTKAENNLWHFPLAEGQNYIVDAEITAGGDAILIEYANDVDAVAREGTGGTDYTLRTPAGLFLYRRGDATWLNNRTVWLDLRGSVYGSLLDVDDEDFIELESTFYEVDSTATYRVALTRNFNPADKAGLAPTISNFELGPGSAYVDITFEGGLNNGSNGEQGTGVWGSNKVAEQVAPGAGELTADHFEATMYVPGQSDPRQLDIASVRGNSGTTGYTDARLTFDFGSYEVTGDEHIIVRTAERGRFSDQFITDRTIFSHATTTRYVPSALNDESYTEALSGIIHLQSGALMQTIPIVEYSIAIAEGTDATLAEGADGDTSTFTFVISRDFAGASGQVQLDLVTSADYASLEVEGSTSGTLTSGSGELWIGFDTSQSATTGTLTFNGNDDSDGDRTFTLSLTAVGAGSDINNAADELTLTVEDDDRRPPALTYTGSGYTFNETDIELDDDKQHFETLADWENPRQLSDPGQQDELLFPRDPGRGFTLAPPFPDDNPTFQRIVVTLMVEGDETDWQLINENARYMGTNSTNRPPGIAAGASSISYTFIHRTGQAAPEEADVENFLEALRIEMTTSEIPAIDDERTSSSALGVRVQIYETVGGVESDVPISFRIDHALQAEDDPNQFIAEGIEEDSTGSVSAIRSGRDYGNTDSANPLIVTVGISNPQANIEVTSRLGYFNAGNAVSGDSTKEGFIPSDFASCDPVTGDDIFADAPNPIEIQTGNAGGPGVRYENTFTFAAFANGVAQIDCTIGGETVRVMYSASSMNQPPTLGTAMTEMIPEDDGNNLQQDINNRDWNLTNVAIFTGASDGAGEGDLGATLEAVAPHNLPPGVTLGDITLTVDGDRILADIADIPSDWTGDITFTVRIPVGGDPDNPSGQGPALPASADGPITAEATITILEAREAFVSNLDDSAFNIVDTIAEDNVQLSRNDPDNDNIVINGAAENQNQTDFASGADIQHIDRRSLVSFELVLTTTAAGTTLWRLSSIPGNVTQMVGGTSVAYTASGLAPGVAETVIESLLNGANIHHEGILDGTSDTDIEVSLMINEVWTPTEGSPLPSSLVFSTAQTIRVTHENDPPLVVLADDSNGNYWRFAPAAEPTNGEGGTITINARSVMDGVESIPIIGMVTNGGEMGQVISASSTLETINMALALSSRGVQLSIDVIQSAGNIITDIVLNVNVTDVAAVPIGGNFGGTFNVEFEDGSGDPATVSEFTLSITTENGELGDLSAEFSLVENHDQASDRSVVIFADANLEGPGEGAFAGMLRLQQPNFEPDNGYASTVGNPSNVNIVANSTTIRPGAGAVAVSGVTEIEANIQGIPAGWTGVITLTINVTDPDSPSGEGPSHTSQWVAAIEIEPVQQDAEYDNITFTDALTETGVQLGSGGSDLFGNIDIDIDDDSRIEEISIILTAEHADDISNNNGWTLTSNQPDSAVRDGNSVTYSYDVNLRESGLENFLNSVRVSYGSDELSIEGADSSGDGSGITTLMASVTLTEVWMMGTGDEATSITRIDSDIITVTHENDPQDYNAVNSVESVSALDFEGEADGASIAECTVVNSWGAGGEDYQRVVISGIEAMIDGNSFSGVSDINAGLSGIRIDDPGIGTSLEGNDNEAKISVVRDTASGSIEATRLMFTLTLDEVTSRGVTLTDYSETETCTVAIRTIPECVDEGRESSTTIYTIHNNPDENGLTRVPVDIGGITNPGCDLTPVAGGAIYVASDINDEVWDGAEIEGECPEQDVEGDNCLTPTYNADGAFLLPIGYSVIEWRVNYDVEGDNGVAVARQHVYVAPTMVLSGIDDKTVYIDIGNEALAPVSENFEFTISRAYRSVENYGPFEAYLQAGVENDMRIVDDAGMMSDTRCLPADSDSSVCDNVTPDVMNSMATIMGNLEAGAALALDINNANYAQFAVANDLTLRVRAGEEPVAPIKITSLAVIANGSTISAIAAGQAYMIRIEGLATTDTNIVVETTYTPPTTPTRDDVDVLQGRFDATLGPYGADDNDGEYVTIRVYQSNQEIYEIDYAIVEVANLSDLTDTDNDGVPDSVAGDSDPSSVRFAEISSATMVTGALTVPDIDGYTIALGSDARRAATDSALNDGVYSFIATIPAEADRAYVAFGLTEPLEQAMTYPDTIATYSALGIVETIGGQQVVSCPAPFPSDPTTIPGDALPWSTVTAGHQCVLLVLEDVDGDRVIHYGQAPQLADDGRKSGGGGGFTDPWMLLLLLVALVSAVGARCRSIASRQHKH